MGNFDEFLYNQEALGFYSSLVFQDILPIDLSGVSMKKIISASQKSKDERDRFKDELERFSDLLFRCESIEHGRQILNDFKNDLIVAKNDLKASQGFLNKNDVGSLVSVGLPTASGIYGALLAAGSSPFEPISIGTSVVIGAIAAYTNYKTAASVRKNPFGAAYLISLEERLSGTGYIPSFDRYMEEFIND